MAIDTVNITAGTGTPIAGDSVGGAFFQGMKLVAQADGTADTFVSATAPLPVVTVATATGGWTTTHLTLAAGANGTRIKATAGTVGGIDITNNSSSMFYVQLHNSAANPPVLNSTAVARKIGVQAGVPRYLSFGDLGLEFTTGIGFTVTTSIADTGVGLILADAGIVDIHWK